MASAHVDTFARDHLPPPEALPELRFDLPALQFPAQLNCATELLDRHVAEGRGNRLCIQAPGLRWTYAELQAQANRIAHVLVSEMGLVPGNRVLLRSPNNPMLAACWFAVLKAGGVVVNFNPLYAEREIEHQILDSGVTVMVTMGLEALVAKLRPQIERTALRRIIVCSLPKALPFAKRLFAPFALSRELAKTEGVKVVDGLPVEGTWRSHQVPLAGTRDDASGRFKPEAAVALDRHMRDLA